eukprot:UN00370
MTDKLDFPFDKIQVIDASERSEHSNAFFVGSGRLKTICLFDTLLNKMSRDEILAILAHEIAHYKNNHILWTLIMHIIEEGLVLYLLNIWINR